MAQISKGILAGFSGTVGTVVGGSWRGISYMRSKPVRKKSYTPSIRQMDQQLKFRLAIDLAHSLGGLIAFSFAEKAVRKTSRNCFVSHVLKDTITGTSPQFEIDYTKVLVSSGSLEGVAGATATAGAPGRIVFTWEDNTEGGHLAKANDRAILVAHCPSLNRSWYITTGAMRSTTTYTMEVSRFSGEEVHTYIGFISEDGKWVSGSEYTGMLNVG
jgi:hypothetical protein